MTPTKNGNPKVKQSILNIFKRKTNGHVVDYSADFLLKKLERINDSCGSLVSTTEKYSQIVQNVCEQEKIFALFLSQNHVHNAGGVQEKLETVARLFESISAQRFSAVVPLQRFAEELKGFKKRAVKDTLETAKTFESCRGKYSGNICLLESTSSTLDPENSKKLRNFKKMQESLRLCKDELHVLDLTFREKIQMLMSSRLALVSRHMGHYNRAVEFSFGKIREHFAGLLTTLKRSEVSSTFCKAMKDFEKLPPKLIQKIGDDLVDLGDGLNSTDNPSDDELLVIKTTEEKPGKPDFVGADSLLFDFDDFDRADEGGLKDHLLGGGLFGWNGGKFDSYESWLNGLSSSEPELVHFDF